MSNMPDETITFLFTDVEDSTRFWEQFPNAMRIALARHDALIREVVERHGGTVIKPRGEGDSQFVTFTQAPDALRAVHAMQNALLAETWPAETPLKVRVALHTGAVERRDSDYYGSAVNRCARIRASAHGSQILLSQLTSDAVRDHLPPGVMLRDMGLHRLKDLQQPERLWQLCQAGWPDDFPPLLSLEVYKHNLPRQLTSFIGREQEMQKIKRLCAHSGLLTLTGSGGCGKTRLALQVAVDIVDDYADGVWMVDLAPLSDPGMVARAIAKRLGHREEYESEALDSLCESLRTKSLLLILDNCEHLAGSVAQAANRLLQSCPELHILATSRIRLNVPGEIVWRVPSLPVPGNSELPSIESALQYASLRLFVERATAARPQFALKDTNLPAITQICCRLDGIPLAIELAAARVNTLTPQQLAERLDKRFHIVVGGSPAALERHQTLHALIHWSYDLLSPREQMLLRRLSVFADGWTLEAADAVGGWGDLETGDILDLLSHLVDASLVIAEEQEGQQRYHFLETVRQYAGDGLEEDERTRTRERHLDYFLDLAEEAEPHLEQADQKDWLARLEVEIDNLRAALTWAIGDNRRLRLACALWKFWSIRSHFEEGRSWLRGALSRPAQSDARLRVKALNRLSILATRQSDYEEARCLLEESMDLCRQTGDRACMAETLNNLATVAVAQEQTEEARDLCARSLELWQSVGDPKGMALVFNNLGILCLHAENYAEARQHFERSLEIYQQQNDQASAAATLGNLGAVCNCLEDYTQARRYWEQGLALDQEFGNRWGIASKRYNLADVAFKQGDYAYARRCLRDCLELRAALQNRLASAYALCAYARVAREMGQNEQVVLLLGAAQVLCETAGAALTEETQQQNKDLLAAARTVLSPPDFHRLWTQGHAMSLEEALGYVQQQTED